MNIQFLTNLLTAQPKKKSTAMPAQDDIPRPIILKLEARPNRTDNLYNLLSEQGFQVVRCTTIKEGLVYARRVSPSLIIVIDHLKHGLDGKKWLEEQHSDVGPHNPAMIPLMIVTDRRRLSTLKDHEIVGRVKVVQKPSDTVEMVDHVKTFLHEVDFKY